MVYAKDFFLQRVKTFQDVLTSNLLISRTLTETDHNEKARILRNGIAIIGFTILEDYIKARTGEIFEEIGLSGISFNSLPEGLRKASTLNALECIFERAKNLDRAGDNFESFIQNETKNISSTLNNPYSLSKFSLGWSKSNLLTADINVFLKVFNVEGGWTAIQKITAKANVSLTSPENVFRNAAMRRHKAAHNPDADSLYSELVDFSKEVKSIAMSYDLLLTRALYFINIGDLDFLNNQKKVKPDEIKLRHLIKDNLLWNEFKEGSSVPDSQNNDYEEILVESFERASINEEILIIQERSNEISDWIISY